MAEPYSGYGDRCSRWHTGVDGAHLGEHSDEESHPVFWTPSRYLCSRSRHTLANHYPLQLANAAGLLFVVEAILVLQPTATQKQKINGAYTHSALNNLGSAGLIAGLIIIEYNKIDHGGEHVWRPPHTVHQR